MSKITDIQWCDSTVNPIMGCCGCELFPPPSQVLAAIDQAVDGTGATINSKRIFKEFVDDAFQSIKTPQPGHKQAVNTTNIWHLRQQFLERLHQSHGDAAAGAAETAIRKAITCYAATLHLNKGSNILKPDYVPKAGYAPIFEAVSTFEGRMEDAAKWQDLLGLKSSENPWKAGLPRIIFVSDMGDALSAKRDFPFLKREAVPAFQSENGMRHLWLWLTKRPGTMAEFAKEIGGFPNNVCTMTTLTGPDDESLKRLADLKKVMASVRGLSIEPLWDRIPPAKLNLTGIDWMIVGGESGSGETTRPFALEWAEELRAHCEKHGMAFFLKQLGRNPSRNGEILKLRDKHGGEWSEWDETLRIREFPNAFHDYRKAEMKPSSRPRPIKEPKKNAGTRRVCFHRGGKVRI
jgi:protein gp37